MRVDDRLGGLIGDVRLGQSPGFPFRRFDKMLSSGYGIALIATVHVSYETFFSSSLTEEAKYVRVFVPFLWTV